MTLRRDKLRLMSVLSVALLATAVLVETPAHGFHADAAAVDAPANELILGPEVRESNELSSIQVADRDSGASFKVYFDKRSAPMARESIPLLASMYRDVARLVAVPPGQVKWDAVLFARNADDLLLVRKPGESLWRVDMGTDGALGEAGARMLIVVVPHEQTHSTQEVDDLPRWYSEGQASWAQMRYLEKSAPERARIEREGHQAVLKASTMPVALGKWGGMGVKPEAFLRQMTPEQRAKFEKDSILPSGPWTFKAGDYVTDESNTEARYAAALAVFEKLEKRAGRAALQAWFKAVREAKTPVNNETIVALALTHTHVDIAADLK